MPDLVSVMRLKGLSVGFAAAASLSISPALSQGQVVACVQTHLASRANPQTMGIAPTTTERTIRQIAASFQLDVSNITIVECSYEASAYAHFEPTEERGIPVGEYLVYSPRWVQQVVGDNPWQIVALFGHELGHFLNRDYARPSLAQIEKEKRADEFAGCAVANLGGDWTAVENLLSRLRDAPGVSDPRYPDRLKSIASARAGYDRCSRSGNAPPVEPATLSNREAGAFRRAEAANTIRSYKEFLDAYPSGELAPNALARLLDQANPINISFMVFFDGDRSSLSSQAMNAIRQAVDAFRTTGAKYAVVAGHTDTSGPEQFRKELTARRAQVVRDALVANGIPANNIIALGRGSAQQLVATGEGVREPQNRRAEIILIR